MRVGLGYDVHKLVVGRDLIIGGVNIPCKNGLLGHSDADVLVHAIVDALLGAASLGDIGKHFPDTSEEYKGISSLFLLKKTAKLLIKHDYIVNNIDATIIAEKPKMANFILLMEENISRTLNIDANAVNIKATTTEKLGFVGKEEGIAAQAIASILHAR
ncbi:MAG: 2-C-methyl-D-erythritol 2,4-cyclodiphosphate synthase [Alkaliphilus sp.]